MLFPFKKKKKARLPAPPDVRSLLFMDFLNESTPPIRIEASLCESGRKTWLIDAPSLTDTSLLALPLRVSYVHNDVLYRFYTRIAGKVLETPLAIEAPKSVERIQRRRFYRLFMESPTTYYHASGASERVRLTARIVNVSEGGLLLHVTQPVQPGGYIVVEVPVGGDEIVLDAKCEILECRPVDGGYHARLSFDSGDGLFMPEAHREMISHFIFGQQRILMKARKLMTQA